MQVNSNFSQSFSNNYSNSFKNLYVETPMTYEAMLKTARDPITGDKFAKAFQELKDVSVNEDIQIAALNKGACITRIDPETQNMLEVLSVNIDSMTVAIEEAVHKITTGLSSHFLPRK